MSASAISRKEDENMRNIFTENYEKEQELKRAYDAAATERQREEIRKEFQKLMNKIGELEPADQMLWRAYEQARECGNERIDLNDCISEEKVVDWIRGFRKYGFREEKEILQKLLQEAEYVHMGTDKREGKTVLLLEFGFDISHE